MKITYHEASTINELRQILSLQSENLHAKLTNKEMRQQGFVSVSHTLSTLQKMNEVCPHIIAKAESEVIGYALSMHPSFASEIPLLQPMFVEIDRLTPRPENYMIMGQICIDRNFRGKGIFRSLYNTMKAATLHEYSSIITEVDAKNLRSLNAHKSIGFKNLKTYHSLGQDWKLILLKIK